MLGARPHTVNKTVIQNLASFSYQECNGTLLPGASADLQQATYSISYTIDGAKSEVQNVVETYTVTPERVVVETQLRQVSSKVGGIVARLPAFLTDGQRNTTVTTLKDGILVSLPGDAVSKLGTTCTRMTATGPSALSWSTEGATYYSRNGFMQAYDGLASTLGNITLTIEPLGTKC